MTVYSFRRRLAALEGSVTNSAEARVGIWIMSVFTAMLFGLEEYISGKQPPQRRGETRSAYEARMIGVPTRYWKEGCKKNPGSVLVAVRDYRRKVDAAPGDKAVQDAAMAELSAFIDALPE
jgi:hypothetical protein